MTTKIYDKNEHMFMKEGGSEMESRWLGDSSEMAGCRQAIGRIMSKLRSSLGAGKEQPRVWLEPAKVPVLRLAVMVVLMMFVGVTGAWGQIQ